MKRKVMQGEQQRRLLHPTHCVLQAGTLHWDLLLRQAHGGVGGPLVWGVRGAKATFFFFPHPTSLQSPSPGLGGGGGDAGQGWGRRPAASPGPCIMEDRLTPRSVNGSE